MRQDLRAGLSQLRRAGARRGTRAAVREGARLARGVAREARLRTRPLNAAPGELGAALGGMDPVAVLRGPVLRALPTVARFERELERHERLLERADAICAHRFDLLGSGPTDLGPEIDWHADFKTGRRWPLRHSSLLPVAYADGSDIRVPWELSRSQHLPLLAGAYRLSGELRYLDELGEQLMSWIGSNPVERGPNWACTMDVAIRAANWTAALALCAEDAAKEPWFRPTLESLLLHGRFIRSHPEDGEVRGNHYLTDVIGLLVVSAVFSSGWEGNEWATWACAELVREMEHQVRGDGCAHEASIPYHRLVTELFVCGTQAADALARGKLPDWYRDRLDSMLAFTRDYTRPDGLAPQIGDADDGRLLPLGDYAALDPRDHRHVFAQADRAHVAARESAAYPEGGFFVMRAGRTYAIVRCGDTGRYGRGGHSHNDQLSFELFAGGRPLVADPGSYVYTSDPEARNLFRSTAYHATLAIGGAEQNELRTDDLFVMEDEANAQALEWEAHSFVGRQRNHTRRIELADGELRITDTVESAGGEELLWTLPLEPGAELDVQAESLEFRPEDGWHSPRYGVRVPATFLRARRPARPGRDEQVLVLRAPS
jgi:Heparinase II/III-like protein/Heparinase II/III N-terminus